MKSVKPLEIASPPAQGRNTDGQIASTTINQEPSNISYRPVLLPLLVGGSFLILWDVAVRVSGSQLFPKPIDVMWGLVELIQKGLLLKYVVASLFRVTWGFALAVLVGIPAGLLLGWFKWAQEAFNPLIQGFRPISPIAWIPVAILWFGVTDAAPVFLIFLASVFPITVSTTAAVKGVQSVYLRAAHNFGWLVVVAAEMIAVNSGLGYLIIDARNAGKRYDLVVAGMVLIGLIGWLLDLLMRQAERLQTVKWAYGSRDD